MDEEDLRAEFAAWHAAYMAHHAYHGDLFCAFKAAAKLADARARRECIQSLLNLRGMYDESADDHYQQALLDAERAILATIKEPPS